MYFAI